MSKLLQIVWITVTSFSPPFAAIERTDPPLSLRDGVTKYRRDAMKERERERSAILVKYNSVTRDRMDDRPDELQKSSRCYFHPEEGVFFSRHEVTKTTSESDRIESIYSVHCQLSSPLHRGVTWNCAAHGNWRASTQYINLEVWLIWYPFARYSDNYSPWRGKVYNAVNQHELRSNSTTCHVVLLNSENCCGSFEARIID